jgi:hypothetical protein
MMGDRRLHGRVGHGEIVRYDRAGKWYVEWPGSTRYHVTLAEAVDLATGFKGAAYLGIPGGGRFDAAVRRKLAA